MFYSRLNFAFVERHPHKHKITVCFSRNVNFFFYSFQCEKMAPIFFFNQCMSNLMIKCTYMLICDFEKILSFIVKLEVKVQIIWPYIFRINLFSGKIMWHLININGMIYLADAKSSVHMMERPISADTTVYKTRELNILKDENDMCLYRG